MCNVSKRPGEINSLSNSSPFEYKLVIVTRRDLKISTGKLVAQACHAAVEASEDGKKINHSAWKKWHDEGSKKVVVVADDIVELGELVEKAKKLDIVNVMIQDRGLTEVAPGTVTVLGIGPDRSDKIDKVTGNLPLLK
ncbi:peptidyl-tRNA hydrolase [Candidatus Bathyarchaeota archaeon]|nr:peptidyl-tRNA hydrolase [Candidatus Bathyarchaeota archaeon]